MDARLTPAQVAPLVRVLSISERERAAQLRRDADRRSFTAARAVLRLALSSALGIAPDGILLEPGLNGKPRLAWPRAGIEFNVSHSGELCAIAVAVARRVGVDVELVRPLADWELIARSAFALVETAAIASLPEDRRLEAFFACWASKESFIKATGDGLSLPLDAFAVEPFPDRPAALLTHRRDPSEVPRWQLQRLLLSPVHAAVVTGEGWDWNARVWDATPR